MSQLSRLIDRLRSGEKIAPQSIPAHGGIAKEIASLVTLTRGKSSVTIPKDLQREAIQRFWKTPVLENLRDAKLVSFGMCIRVRESEPCIMEDRRMFQATLNRETGVDQWLGEPRKYRRCYQGLVGSYFAYEKEKAPAIGKQNWNDLRQYLYDRNYAIRDDTSERDWVKAAVENRQVFGQDPCAPYAEAVLFGDASAIDRMSEQLGIIKASWFLDELLLAQVKRATQFGAEKFQNLLQRLLQLLESNEMVRDRGLVLVLNRYAELSDRTLHLLLRDTAVKWWGNPWLPSRREHQWGVVSAAAREMVADWLKQEFVDAFFSKLAKDGVGGTRRRARFWMRYIKSMDNVQFALGSSAMHSHDKDMVVLRQKMKGLITGLRTQDSSNNAFVMTLGNLVAVEFGSESNAFYGYDRKMTLPFDMSQAVGTAKRDRNPLKSDQCTLWLQHQDGIHGFRTWERMFEARLAERGVSPDEQMAPIEQPPQRSDHIGPVLPTPTQQKARLATVTSQPPSTLAGSRVPAPVARASTPPGRSTFERPPVPGVSSIFSDGALAEFSVARNLKIEEQRGRGGNLWVRTGDTDIYVNNVLRTWGFKYRPGKGWWK